MTLGTYTKRQGNRAGFRSSRALLVVAILCWLARPVESLAQPFLGKTLAVNQNPSSVAVGDFNEDGNLDIAVDWDPSSPGQVQILLGKGNGDFLPATSLTCQYFPGNILVADFNQDGHLDIAVLDLVSSFGSGPTHTLVDLFLGKGDGTFGAEQQIDTGGIGMYFFVVADVNEDSKPDLVVLHNGSDDVGILYGNGDGTFQSPVVVPVWGTGTNQNFKGFAVADFNGDGRTDFAILTASQDGSSGTIDILYQAADHTFSRVRVASVSDQPWTTVSADLNHDGRQDLVVGNNYGATVFLQNASGSFYKKGSYGSGFADSITITDFNNDGIPDLLLSYYFNHSVGCLRGVGDGSFIEQTTCATGVIPLLVAAGDFNSDSRGDFVVQLANTNAVMVFMNKNRLQYEIGQIIPPPTNAVSVYSNSPAGPAVSPPGLAVWVSNRLYAAQAGVGTNTWQTRNGAANDVVISVTAPPLRSYDLGQEVLPPTFADPSRVDRIQGPTVQPPGACYWSSNSATPHLYAVNSGLATVTWLNAVGVPIPTPISINSVQSQFVDLAGQIQPPPNADISKQPYVFPSGSLFWHAPSSTLYATTLGQFLVTWYNSAGSSIAVPVQTQWPTATQSYQTYVLGSPPVDLSNGGAMSAAQLMYQESGVGIDPYKVQNSELFSASGPGRSLLMLAPTNAAVSPAIYFLLARTITWTDPAYVYTNATAVIGQPITDFVGFHDASLGSPYVLNALSRYCALTNYCSRAQRTGPIIPVNRNDPNSSANDLVLVCYEKGNTLITATNGQLTATSIAWPYKPIRYNCVWPTGSPSIVIANGQGTGPIDSSVYRSWDIYVQNDPTLPGFNPNDEHAFITAGTNGSAGIFALRGDLGTPATSEPYVLMTYQDGNDGNKPKIQVFQVLSGNFQYTGEVPNLIQPPFPLNQLQACSESYGQSGPFWRDRKLSFWARAAGNDGQTTNIVLRYFYPIQPTFYFPSNYFSHFPGSVSATNLPAVGAHFPWLDVAAGTPGSPIDVTYTVHWPTGVPQLAVGETLVHAKWGLPEFDGQDSVEIIYQQSLAKGQSNSVELIDPTALRQVALAQLPVDVITANNAGYVYFPTLPPQLRNRLYYDPINHNLDFVGQFIKQYGAQEPVSYLLLNVISAQEKAVLMGMSTDTAWKAAINDLSAQASRVIQVPPNTPFNRPLALTAVSGGGQGYVTLVFNNSTNLAMVQPAEPITTALIQVVCPVYQGQLEVIESDNPFDETLTLRHSGDFAGEPNGYVFGVFSVSSG
jgi:hypothetical protein